MDLVCVGGIGFNSLPALSSLHICSLVWCHLRPIGVMPRCLVVSITSKIDAPVPHQYILFSYPYRFGDRHVSIPDRAIPLATSATLTDPCYQKRAMPASLSLHHYLILPPIPWTDTVSLCMLDDVVVTSVFRSPITKFVLASVSRWNRC
jgi:hypothetical protein